MQFLRIIMLAAATHVTHATTDDTQRLPLIEGKKCEVLDEARTLPGKRVQFDEDWMVALLVSKNDGEPVSYTVQQEDPTGESFTKDVSAEQIRGLTYETQKYDAKYDFRGIKMDLAHYAIKLNDIKGTRTVGAIPENENDLASTNWIVWSNGVRKSYSKNDIETYVIPDQSVDAKRIEKIFL